MRAARSCPRRAQISLSFKPLSAFTFMCLKSHRRRDLRDRQKASSALAPLDTSVLVPNSCQCTSFFNFSAAVPAIRLWAGSARSRCCGTRERRPIAAAGVESPRGVHPAPLSIGHAGGRDERRIGGGGGERKPLRCHCQPRWQGDPAVGPTYVCTWGANPPPVQPDREASRWPVQWGKWGSAGGAET